jgi:hypothetical protein
MPGRSKTAEGAKHKHAPCECGAAKEYRKHYCPDCTIKHIAESNKKENAAKAQARKGPGRPIGVSGYPGVYRSAAGPNWTGEVRTGAKRINIGTWPTPKEAYDARVEIYFSVYGEYPVDKFKTPAYNESVKDEANTPLERYNQVMQFLINIA